MVDTEWERIDNEKEKDADLAREPTLIYRVLRTPDRAGVHGVLLRNRDRVADW